MLQGKTPAETLEDLDAFAQRIPAASPPLAVGGASRRDATRALPPGATLGLYTDGLVERRRENLDIGFARLQAVLADNRHLSLGQLAKTVVAQMQPAQHEDDIALPLYRIPSGDAKRLSVSIPADPAELAPLRRTLLEWLADSDAPELTNAVLVSVCEACSNAIEHAYRLGMRTGSDDDG